MVKIKYITEPYKKTFRRPYKSASRPAVKRKQPFATLPLDFVKFEVYEYAATTHVKLELSIDKSFPIDGNAIFTLPTLIAYHQIPLPKGVTFKAGAHANVKTLITSLHKVPKTSGIFPLSTLWLSVSNPGSWDPVETSVAGVPSTAPAPMAFSISELLNDRIFVAIPS
jgi:hypothetical protein